MVVVLYHAHRPLDYWIEKVAQQGCGAQEFFSESAATPTEQNNQNAALKVPAEPTCSINNLD